MIVAFYILVAMLVVGTILFIHHRLTYGSHSDQADTPVVADDSQCCGMHVTCEKDSLLSSVSETIEYYDDEELDRYAGRQANEYSSEEIEEFREILLSLIPEDIAGWGRSIQLRNINLPNEIRDELFMIISEARQAKTA